MSNRILLVEDSRSQALRIQLELVRYGLTVDIATTGTTGFDAARQQLPDAIILDVDLPELDGFSLCRKLKADPDTAHIPIVMLTRRDEANDTLAGLQVGAEDYIPKDAFAEHNLLESLRHLGVL
jgi:DNA-binding response OmpR family regulator